MFGCVSSQLKPPEFYIPSCGKGLGFSIAKEVKVLGLYPSYQYITPFGYDMKYLPLFNEADTPFHIQGAIDVSFLANSFDLSLYMSYYV